KLIAACNGRGARRVTRSCRLALALRHVDVAVEGGTVLDRQPAHAHVALYAPGAGEQQAVLDHQVALQVAAHVHVAALDVGLDGRLLLDPDVAGRSQLALHGPLDPDVTFGRELADQAVARPQHDA